MRRLCPKVARLLLSAAGLCGCGARGGLEGDTGSASNWQTPGTASGGAKAGASGGQAGSDGTGGQASSGPHADLPGELLVPGKCDSGFSPHFFDELPSCESDSDNPCRDELDRLVLPVDVDVLDMGAQDNRLFVRTTPFAHSLSDNDALNQDLVFLTRAPAGDALIQASNIGVFFIESGCTPRCGEWLTFLNGPYNEQAPLVAHSAWQEPASNMLATSMEGATALWAHTAVNGPTRVGYFDASANYAFNLSYELEDELIGLALSSWSAYLATSGGELIQLSLPDLQEVKRITAEGSSFAKQGALLGSGFGMLLFSAAPDGRILARSVSPQLELSSPGYDVSDVKLFAQEFDDWFVATDDRVAFFGSPAEDSRNIMATTSVPGSISAIAFDDPYLYVASRGQLTQSDGFRTVIDALDVGTCTGLIR